MVRAGQAKHSVLACGVHGRSCGVHGRSTIKNSVLGWVVVVPVFSFRVAVLRCSALSFCAVVLSLVAVFSFLLSRTAHLQNLARGRITG